MNCNEHLRHWGFKLVEANIRLCISSKKSLDSLIITLNPPMGLFSELVRS